MFVVVTYDSGDDRRRQKLSEALAGYGQRVQRSVFECDVTPRQWAELRRRLGRLARPPDDSVRCYLLCAECVRAIDAMGGAAPYRAPRLYLV